VSLDVQRAKLKAYAELYELSWSRSSSMRPQREVTGPAGLQRALRILKDGDAEHCWW